MDATGTVANVAEKVTETVSMGAIAGAKGGWFLAAYIVGGVVTVAYEASRTGSRKPNPHIIPVENYGLRMAEIVLLWPIHLGMIATGLGMPTPNPATGV